MDSGNWITDTYNNDFNVLLLTFCETFRTTTTGEDGHSFAFILTRGDEGEVAALIIMQVQETWTKNTRLLFSSEQVMLMQNKLQQYLFGMTLMQTLSFYNRFQLNISVFYKAVWIILDTIH